MITADIVKHIAKFIEGREYREEPGLTVTAIREALEDGTFLVHPTTLDYRKLYIIPELVFEYGNRDELIAHAREKAKQMVAEHEYALPDDTQTNVAEVYEAAKKDLLGN